MAGLIYSGTMFSSRINASAFEVGMAFHVSAGVTVTGLAWCRTVTGGGIAPEIVRLWRAGDTTELGRLSPVPDDGTVAWQEGNLATPIALVTGQTYIASAYFPGSGGQPSASLFGGSPATPVVLESNYRRYLSGASGFPASADAGSYIGTDILTATVGGGGGGGGSGASAGDVAAELAKWLSTDGTTQTHELDGLPWATKLLLDAWNSGLGAGATGYFAFMKAAVAAIRERTDRLPDSIQALTNGILTALAADVTAIQGGLATIQAGVDSLTAGSGGTAGGVLGTLSGRSGFPADPWVLVAEDDFAGSVAITVPADLYAVSIDTFAQHIGTTLTDGPVWRPRAGWWAPLNGTFVADHRYLNHADSHLLDNGRRMPGALVYTGPGSTGHWQAWTLT